MSDLNDLENKNKKSYKSHCFQFSEKTLLVWNTKESMKENLKKYNHSNKILKVARYLGGEVQSFAQKQINANNKSIKSLMMAYYQLQGEFHTLYEKHYEEFLERLNNRPEPVIKKTLWTFENSNSSQVFTKTKTLRQKTIEFILESMDEIGELPSKGSYEKELKEALKKELVQQ